MSKKSRRLRTPNLPPEAFATPQMAPSRAPGRASGATGAAAKAAASVTASAKGIDWRHEYGAVLGDLKRTGILASILLVVMVVLSFIIP